MKWKFGRNVSFDKVIPLHCWCLSMQNSCQNWMHTRYRKAHLNCRDRYIKSGWVYPVHCDKATTMPIFAHLAWNTKNTNNNRIIEYDNKYFLKVSSYTLDDQHVTQSEFWEVKQLSLILLTTNFPHNVKQLIWTQIQLRFQICLCSLAAFAFHRGIN